MLGADEKTLFTWEMFIGVTLAMLGFGMYTQTKIVKMRRHATAVLADENTTPLLPAQLRSDYVTNVKTLEP